MKSGQWTYSPPPKISSVLFFQTKASPLCFGFKGVWRKCLSFKSGHFHPFWRCKYVHNLKYFFRLCRVQLYFPFLFYQRSPSAAPMFTTDMSSHRILSQEELRLGFIWEGRVVLEELTALNSFWPAEIILGELDEQNDHKPNRVFSPTMKLESEALNISENHGGRGEVPHNWINLLWLCVIESKYWELLSYLIMYKGCILELIFLPVLNCFILINLNKRFWCPGRLRRNSNFSWDTGQMGAGFWQRPLASPSPCLSTPDF